MEAQISGLRNVPISLYNYIHRLLEGFGRRHKDDTNKSARKGADNYRHCHDTQALAATAWQGPRFLR
jgi:RecB family exonuclease